MSGPALGFVAVLAVLLGGCAGPRISVDWDSAYDFAALETYTWAESTRSEAGTRLTFLDRRIRRAVDDELAAKGYQRKDRGGDFLVVYTAKVRDRVDVTRHRYRWHGYTSIDRYREGSLVLGIVDRRRDEVIWTGWAEGIVSQTGQSEEKIRSACARILEKFPPS